MAVQHLLLCYDITSQRTFSRAFESWLPYLLRLRVVSLWANSVVVVAGTRADLAKSRQVSIPGCSRPVERGRQVSYEEGLSRTMQLKTELQAQHPDWGGSILFLETSAKTGHHVHEVFDHFAHQA